MRACCHSVSSFDHVVTQWMSTTTGVCGSAWNSTHIHFPSSDPPSCSANPRMETHLRRRPRRQHRKVRHQVLSRRDGRAPPLGPVATTESSRDGRLVDHERTPGPLDRPLLERGDALLQPGERIHPGSELPNGGRVPLDFRTEIVNFGGDLLDADAQLADGQVV